MKTYNEIQIGDSAVVTHVITDADIKKFVDLTGDDNKLHIDKEFAKKTEFKKPVVHGMIGASFISTLIGTKLPGDGALWFSQTLEFLRPVRVGDTIIVTAVVISKNDKAQAIELKTEITNQHKQVVTSGISKVKVIPVEEESEVGNAGNITNKKSVLILGASGGVGQAVAMKLAKEGFDLILHYYTNKKNVEEIKLEVEKLGRKVLCVRANLMESSDINSLTEALKRDFSDLTGFINCSTVKLPNIKFENLEWKDIETHIDINIKSSFLILKELLPIFIKKKYGKIVFLSTQAIETPNSEWLHYITAKSGLAGFVKALAIEFAGRGIRVNSISPSMIETDLVSEIPQKVKMLIEAKTPLHRLCKVEDVAEAAYYLLSDKSDFITGETIRVNGGQVML